MTIPIGVRPMWQGKEMTVQEVAEYNRRFSEAFFNPESVARLAAAIKKQKALMASLNKRKK